MGFISEMRNHVSRLLAAYAVGSLLFFSMSGQAADIAAESLEFHSKKGQRSLTLSELKKKLPLVSIEVEDPTYRKRKTYEGFLLRDVLKAFGANSNEGDELVFHCHDGYSPTLSWDKVFEKKGVLAIREKKRPGLSGKWEKIRQGKADLDPSPFYLVWDTSDPIFPWPYQLTGLEVVNFKEKFSRIFPQGVAQDSAVFQGFTHFRTSCVKCHSLNLQGGEVGPELNIPRNITEYWSSEHLKEFIRNPAQYRARSKMPPTSQYSDAQIDEILEYLKWMKAHKVQDFPRE
jgi:mono/diheme cytochrome c family protein